MRRLRLSTERLAELATEDLAGVAGGAPPSWYDCPTVPLAPCLSLDRSCPPLITGHTCMCPTEG